MNTKHKKILDINILFSRAWDIYKENWLNFILIGFIFLIVSSISGFSGMQNAIHGMQNHNMMPHYNILNVLTWLATTYLSIGYVRYLIHLVEGKKAKIEEIFHGVDSIQHFVFVIVVGFIVNILVFLGLLLLIIPGIILGLGLMFSKYIIIENKGRNVGIVEALKKSWQITKGHRWTLLGLVIVLALFNILGVLALLIGLIITIPVSSLMLVGAYKTLSE